MFCVYLIERDDGLKYIGKTKTKNLRYRIHSHQKTKRFKNYKINYKILEHNNDHDYILEKETYFINEYDTFKKGLNKTPHGKGKHNNSYKFTTLGFTMSDETKNKIRNKSIKNKNYLHAQKWRENLSGEERKEYSEKLSLIRKGKVQPGVVKLNECVVEEILLLYINKPDVGYIGKCPKSGNIITYERAFANKYSKIYNISSQHILNLIKGTTITWKPLYKKIILNIVS